MRYLLMMVMLAAAICFGDERYNVEQLGKLDVRVETAVKRGELIISVFNKRGIGGCRVQTKGKFPPTVRLRLFYEKTKPFKRLEGLTVKTDGVAAEWVRVKKELHWRDAKGGKRVVKVNLHVTDKGYEIEFPAKFFDKTTAIQFKWVNLYR